MILGGKTKIRGTSLIEATVAAFVAAVFLASLFTLNMTGMKTIRTAREATSASQILQQRIESLRIANWQQVTNADWLKNNLLNTDAAGTSGLKQMTETLTLVPYGSGTVGDIQIVRTGGTSQITSRTSSLLTEHAVKVIWTVNYHGGINSTAKTRQTVAILAKGGVAKW